MAKFINLTPQCDLCRGELAMTSIQIDMINCNYILFCECIMCGEEQIILLSLQDFVDISKLLNKPPNLLGEGGNREN